LPIRIYALAKQLKVEHKTLVDICTQIGISGKHSALASLSEEEVAAVKAHLEQKARGTRSSSIGAGSDRGAAVGGGAVRREDYVPPAGSGPRKIPVLVGKKPEKPAAPKKPSEGEGPPKSPEKTMPGIKLAPIPVAQQPTPSKPAEPAPQKPELRLPPDVIRASKAGARPLSEHLRKQEQLRRKAAPPSKVSPVDRGPASSRPRPSRRRQRRSGKGIATRIAAAEPGHRRPRPSRKKPGWPSAGESTGN